MIKRLIRLGAAAALAALMIPASASAAEWQLNGEPLKEQAEVQLSGPFGFTAGTNGFHMILDATLTLEPGSTGAATSVIGTECTGTGGLASFICDVTANNLSWLVHCNENGSVTITNVNLTNQYTPAGLAPNTTLTGNVVATGEGGTLDSVSLSGEGTKWDVQGVAEPVTATVEGTLEAATAGYSCA